MHLGYTGQQWEELTDRKRFEHIDILLEHFKKYINYWLIEGKLEGDCVIDRSIYADVIRHYYKDLGRMSENIISKNHQPAHPDDFKQKAIYAFWIRKLKPIKLNSPIIGVEGEYGTWINEIIAIFIALTELDAIYERDLAMQISPDLFHDLLYFFRYKSVSPHALYLVFASLYFEI